MEGISGTNQRCFALARMFDGGTRVCRPSGSVVVVELKKMINPIGAGCDQDRLLAFRPSFRYQFGALVECEIRTGSEPAMKWLEWIANYAGEELVFTAISKLYLDTRGFSVHFYRGCS